MTSFGLYPRLLFVALAFAALSPASAAVPEDEMARLLRDQPLPFEYRCSAPLTRKFRIEDHTTARHLGRRVDEWKQCVTDYSARLQSFVNLEHADSAGPAARMSAEQKERYRAALDKRARAEIAAIQPKANATVALINDAYADFGSRISELGYPEEEFEKIVKRFDDLVYDCVAPEPITARDQGFLRMAFFKASDEFLHCGRAWEYRAARFNELASQGKRGGFASQKEFDTMSADQQERFVALLSRAYTMTVVLYGKQREHDEQAHQVALEQARRSNP